MELMKIVDNKINLLEWFKELFLGLKLEMLRIRNIKNKGIIWRWCYRGLFDVIYLEIDRYL